MIVVLITWRDGSTIRQQHFGPWEILPGWPHLDSINTFVKAWMERHGQPLDVLLSVVTPPDEALDTAEATT